MRGSAILCVCFVLALTPAFTNAVGGDSVVSGTFDPNRAPATPSGPVFQGGVPATTMISGNFVVPTSFTTTQSSNVVASPGTTVRHFDSGAHVTSTSSSTPPTSTTAPAVPGFRQPIRPIEITTPNPCLVNNGGCEDTCENNRGLALCSCKDGIVDLNDHKSCKPYVSAVNPVSPAPPSSAQTQTHAAAEDDGFPTKTVGMLIGIIVGVICLERLVSSCRKVYRRKQGLEGFASVSTVGDDLDSEESLSMMERGRDQYYSQTSSRTEDILEGADSDLTSSFDSDEDVNELRA